MAVLFDTRAYHRTLTDAGVPSDRADAHMRAIGLALDGGVATQQGLTNVQTVLHDEIVRVDNRLSVEITTVRTEVKGEIADLRGEVRLLRKDVDFGLRDTKIWTGSVMVAVAGVIIPALKLLP